MFTRVCFVGSAALSLLVAAVGQMCSVAEAETITAEPDAYAAGTDISTLFSGVTLSTISSETTDSAVYSVTPSDPQWASTSPRVFGNGSIYGQYWWDISPSFYGHLKADFDLLANQVMIDFVGNNGSDYGILEAYGTGNVLLTSVTTPDLTSGMVYTATINRASYDIDYIVATGFGGDDIHIDYLRANVVPAPTTLIALVSMGLVGLVGLVWRRRRK